MGEANSGSFLSYVSYSISPIQNGVYTSVTGGAAVIESTRTLMGGGITLYFVPYIKLSNGTITTIPDDVNSYLTFDMTITSVYNSSAFAEYFPNHSASISTLYSGYYAWLSKASGERTLTNQRGLAGRGSSGYAIYLIISTNMQATSSFQIVFNKMIVNGRNIPVNFHNTAK
ncbi:MAG: hypothetical protein HDT39_04720 [Lachnospiraceae bacterium]|nr:hypothetical protein [Lachnospiraceae bacterium]